MSIFCQATGTIVSCTEREDGSATTGRIVTADNQKVQFTARRVVLREALRALPMGTPVALSGELQTFARQDKHRSLYVHRDLAVSLVQPVHPPAENFLQTILTRKAKP